LIAAITVARLIVATDHPEPAEHQHMPGMGGPVPVAHWGWVEFTAIAVAVAALIWWLVSRRTIPAVLAGAALTVVAASGPVRIISTQSHLVAMVALEVLLVLAPLLILTANRPSGSSRRPNIGWTVCAGTAGVAYAALLIVGHVPAVHRRAAEIGAAPLWIAIVALAIGICYWFAVLRTGARVPLAIRKAVLLGAQEVAAFIGLLSLFGAWGAMGYTSPLRISPAWDQRLGGLFMIATCVAVAIPLYRRLT
jgi:cytochrome c oxidase assembly factor CtaG